MRKINTRDFRVATRTTSRDINRRIALNLITNVDKVNEVLANQKVRDVGANLERCPKTNSDAIVVVR